MTTAETRTRLREHGLAPEDIWAAMEQARAGDIDWRDPKTRGPVYFAGDDVVAVAAEAYARFLTANGLYARAFPSVARFEAEVIEMTSDLLHNERAIGSVTSGGSESILLAVKAARDRARAERGVTEPEMVVPVSAHPAFNKAARYFGLTITRTPLDADFRADVAALRAALTPNTVFIAGSAPCWPFGTIDPIPELAALAAERDINFHTDSCLGGFFLPFAEQLGHPIPPFDFRVRGVVSISADLHKYGYAARGTSTLTWRDEDHARYQWFEFDEWPSGLYRTPGASGSRPGGALAAAWAVMHYLGAKGYRAAAERDMAVTRRLLEGVARIPGLKVLGQPAMCLFALGTDDFDIYAVAEGLEDRGWSVSRGKTPPSIHMMVYNSQLPPWADDYLRDLEEVVAQVRRSGAAGRSRDARYGSS